MEVATFKGAVSDRTVTGKVHEIEGRVPPEYGIVPVTTCESGNTAGGVKVNARENQTCIGAGDGPPTGIAGGGEPSAVTVPLGMLKTGDEV